MPLKLQHWIQSQVGGAISLFLTTFQYLERPGTSRIDTFSSSEWIPCSIRGMANIALGLAHFLSHRILFWLLTDHMDDCLIKSSQLEYLYSFSNFREKRKNNVL